MPALDGLILILSLTPVTVQLGDHGYVTSPSVFAMSEMSLLNHSVRAAFSVPLRHL